LLQIFLLFSRHDICQAAVVPEVLHVLLPLLWAPASPQQQAAGGGGSGWSLGCESHRARSRLRPVM